MHSLPLALPFLSLNYPEIASSFLLHVVLTHALSTPTPSPALWTLTWNTVTNKTPFWRPFRFLQLVETPGNLSRYQPIKKLPPQPSWNVPAKRL